PSNPEIRDLLIPVIDDHAIPEPVPGGFERVLREIDRYLATRPPSSSDASSAATTDATATEEVRRVADLLRGTTLVLIGGVRRPHAHEALRSAFELRDVDWVETREHESIDRFEPHVARPGVHVVLLAIRWASHSFGDVT